MLDEAGRLRIVGRVKDMFIVGGFNAYPAEIENALLRHPAVQQAAVIGIPDQRLGEVGMAFVVVSGDVSGDDIIEWSRNEMANYKVPRVVEIVDALPLNATGKVHEGRAPGPGRRAARPRRPDDRPDRADRAERPPGLTALDRPARGRDGRLGRRAVGRRAAGRLGRRRHQGGAAERRPDAQRLRLARHRQGLPQPGLRAGQPGQAQRRARPAPSPRPGSDWRSCSSTADVFLTNLRPDALDGLGLEPAATVARHPRLVYCSVSGYGLRGEDRNRPAYDIGAFWARSGLSVQLANSEGVPLNARGGIGDHISGLAALAGLLAAVLEQRQTGRGRVVEVSLLRTGTYVLGWDLSLQETVGKVAKAEARHSNQTPLMNSYRTKDGRWFFFTGLEADRHIDTRAAAPSAGRTCATTPASPTPGRCARTAREVIAVLDDIVGRAHPRRVGRALRRARASGGRRRRGRPTCSRTRSSPPTTGSSSCATRPTGRSRRSINGPVSFSDLPVGPAAPAPLLGEHTDEVLAELADAATGRERRGAAQA